MLSKLKIRVASIIGRGRYAAMQLLLAAMVPVPAASWLGCALLCFAAGTRAQVPSSGGGATVTSRHATCSSEGYEELQSLAECRAAIDEVNSANGWHGTLLSVR